MGAGEQWYGKQKCKPSGAVEGDYNVMGFDAKGAETPKREHWLKNFCRGLKIR